MSRIIYFIGKSGQNILTRPLAVTTSLISLLLLFIMLALVWVVSLTGHKYYRTIQSEVNLEMFLDDSLPDSTVTAIIQDLSLRPEIKYSVYVSKEKAREKLLSLMGADLLDGLETNPLPRSIIIEFQDSLLTGPKIKILADTLINISGINEIYYPAQWLERIEYSRALLRRLIIFLAAIISAAIILNLLHAIKLSARMRQEELFQLQLLGATKKFLAIPYIIESFFFTLSASTVAWLIVFYAGDRITFRDLEIVFPPVSKVVIFCLMSAAAGILSGIAAMRRSLK